MDSDAAAILQHVRSEQPHTVAELLHAVRADPNCQSERLRAEVASLVSAAQISSASSFSELLASYSGSHDFQSLAAAFRASISTKNDSAVIEGSTDTVPPPSKRQATFATVHDEPATGGIDQDHTASPGWDSDGDEEMGGFGGGGVSLFGPGGLLAGGFNSFPGFGGEGFGSSFAFHQRPPDVIKVLLDAVEAKDRNAIEASLTSLQQVLQCKELRQLLEESRLRMPAFSV